MGREGGEGVAAADEMMVTMRLVKKKKKTTMDRGVENKQGKGEEEEEEPSIHTDKLSYEMFSVMEDKFLFGCDHHELWVPKAPPLPSPAKSQRGKVCVLCIDGGGGSGMRGIQSGKALAYLEQAIRSRSGNTDARISDYFDVAAGTGVGGVFAAMLFATRDGARPIFHADDTWRLLADHGKILFPKDSPYACSSSRGFFRRIFRGGEEGRTAAAATPAMEKVMKQAFGERLTLRDTVKPVLIPCYDLRSSAPLVFSRADALESESFDFRLWEACRATCAEPGRFEPAEIRSVDRATACVGIDGGLAMSNPAAAAITHVLHNKKDFPFVRGVEDLMVLSLGCGASTVPELERLRRWSAKEWARPVARIAADSAADLVDQAVALAFGQCRSCNRSSNYVRIQANPSSMGRGGVDVDCDPSPANVKVLLEAAEEMLKQQNVESVLFSGRRIGEQTNMERLDWFAGELELEHRRRSCRGAATVAFKQAASTST
ncbi:unnamed protein product [Musa textilis]